MDDEYDVIVLGTGLKECILSGLLSSAGKKVLHMDRNDFYGGESASLNLEQVYRKFRGEEAKCPEKLGRARDYCIDLCPKLIMANGNLVKILLQTKCNRYLEFKSITGSYVFQGGKAQKVPATGSEAIHSSLLGLFQKRRFRNFLTYVNNYKEDDAKTHEKQDLFKQTAQECFEYWKLEATTQQFVGHAIALESEDSYRNKPAIHMVRKCQLYAESLARFGNSPYIYPMWGLGGLPEGFSRMAAVHGGVFMLNTKIDEILYDTEGKVTGVSFDGHKPTCKQLIADPSYVLGSPKVKKTGQVARCIVIMDHPIPNTNDADSCQIILPAPELKNRKNNVYISLVSYHHKIASQGKYVAVCAAKVEGPEADVTDDASQTTVAKFELQAALALLGTAEETFFWVSDFYEPTTDGKEDNVFLTHSYDPTTHFETATKEVLTMFETITGKPLDLSIVVEEGAEE